jgi:hypothetical protein
VVEFPEDKTLPPGSWYLWRTGKQRIFLACPMCSQVVSIDPEEVEILKDGRLSKIIDCPNMICDFTDAIRLKGWGARGSSSSLPKI